MRQVLFRGKRIDNGEWAYGYYGVFGDTQQIFVPNAEARFCGKPIYGMWHIVNPETVGEFTGLTDKNGTKVFEGDIVKFHLYDACNKYEVVGVVEFWQVACTWIINVEGKGWGEKVRLAEYIDCEVVGNIYDNADLLEGKNEQGQKVL